MSVRFLTPADFFFRGEKPIGAADDLSNGTGVYPAGTPPLPDVRNFALVMQVYQHGTTGDFEPWFCTSDRHSNGNYFFSGMTDHATPHLWVDTNGIAVGGSLVPTGAWIVLAVAMGASGGLRVYWKLLGTAGDWTAVHANAAFGGTTPPKRAFLGGHEWGGQHGNYSYANCRIWSGGAAGAKSSAALLAEADSATLLDATDIYGWYKCRPGALHVDASANAYDWSVRGVATNGVDSPLEAPDDVPAGASAEGFGVLRRMFVGVGAGTARAHGSGAAIWRTMIRASGAAHASTHASGAAVWRTSIKASGAATSRAHAAGAAVWRRAIAASGTAHGPGASVSASGMGVMRRFIVASGSALVTSHAHGAAAVWRRLVGKGRASTGDSAAPIEGYTAVRVLPLNTGVIIRTTRTE